MSDDVLRKMRDVVQEDARMRPERSEVMRLLSDPSNARRSLGWEPAVALEDGIRATAQWLEQAADWFALESYAV